MFSIKDNVFSSKNAIRKNSIKNEIFNKSNLEPEAGELNV